ncbi:hypothetical protein BD309DRAFT_962892 [Dichomitus squalens]|uniref:Uncharacterized protein n=1 Tax=Dichomitus squalens TaxID=114155 RepID=A0A4V2K3Z5_9APHY|nr:hypothetical protein BD309DRAFT_962892 [Dichomitus squalens]TBU58941.1 hypothetical protein BD310DRAFT_926144 [Dichomitus squalens]
MGPRGYGGERSNPMAYAVLRPFTDPVSGLLAAACAVLRVGVGVTDSSSLDCREKCWHCSLKGWRLGEAYPVKSRLHQRK